MSKLTARQIVSRARLGRLSQATELMGWMPPSAGIV